MAGFKRAVPVHARVSVHPKGVGPDRVWLITLILNRHGCLFCHLCDVLSLISITSKNCVYSLPVGIFILCDLLCKSDK